MRLGRIFFGPPMPAITNDDDLKFAMRGILVGQQRKLYADGVRDGFEIVLNLLLGKPDSGVPPFQGPVPDDIREWAERALSKVRAI